MLFYFILFFPSETSSFFQKEFPLFIPNFIFLSQNKGKESENSYQKLKRSLQDRHTKTRKLYRNILTGTAVFINQKSFEILIVQVYFILVFFLLFFSLTSIGLRGQIRSYLIFSQVFSRIFLHQACNFFCLEFCTYSYNAGALLNYVYNFQVNPKVILHEVPKKYQHFFFLFSLVYPVVLRKNFISLAVLFLSVLRIVHKQYWFGNCLI